VFSRARTRWNENTSGLRLDARQESEYVAIIGPDSPRPNDRTRQSADAGIGFTPSVAARIRTHPCGDGVVAIRASLLSLKLNRSLREETEQLFEAYQSQAKAGRSSRQIGQRFQTLDAIREAIEVAKRLDLPREKLGELRNEALALPDLRPGELDGHSLTGSKVLRRQSKK